jgi:hypothetical protein
MSSPPADSFVSDRAPSFINTTMMSPAFQNGNDQACRCRDATRQQEKVIGVIGLKVGTPKKPRGLRGGAI